MQEPKGWHRLVTRTTVLTRNDVIAATDLPRGLREVDATAVVASPDSLVVELAASARRPEATPHR